VTRTGYVAEAAIASLAAALSTELRLERDDLERPAGRQVDQLVREGFQITVPVTALAASARRHKTSR
jgi:hypothetical protein